MRNLRLHTVLQRLPQALGDQNEQFPRFEVPRV
jgi:hypothetical protein